MEAESLWRVTSFGKAAGPWRRTRALARRDAIDLGLGEFDEHGQFYLIVPGDIEVRRLGFRKRA